MLMIERFLPPKQLTIVFMKFSIVSDCLLDVLLIATLTLTLCTTFQAILNSFEVDLIPIFVKNLFNFREKTLASL